MATHRKQPRPATSHQAGYSLIELLIITVVIGIIAAIALVSLLNALEKSKQRATMADMRTISKAIEGYQIDWGHYPIGTLTGPQLVPLLKPAQSSAIPEQDHWRHDYIYTTDGNGAYTVESYGKDGIDGLNIDPSTRWEFERDIVISNGMFTHSPEP